MHLLVEGVIAACCPLVAVEESCAWLVEIAIESIVFANAGPKADALREWLKILEKRERLGRKQRCGDNIMRVRCRCPLLVDSSCSTELSKILAEVSASDSAGSNFVAESCFRQKRGWQCISSRSANLLALRFIVAKEEEFVLLYWTANRSTEAVLQAGRNGARCLREWVASIVRIAGTEVIRAAVEGVGARSRLGGNNSRYSLAQLSIEVLRGDLGLGDRIHCWVDDDDSQNRILVISSVQFECGPAKGLAVHLNLLGTLWVFIGCVRPPKKLGAGEQKLEVGKVLIANRQARNLLLVKYS